LLFGVAAPTLPAPAQPAPRAAGAAFDLAVTVDDLPWSGARHVPAQQIVHGTEAILAALDRHRVRATGFVICDELRRAPRVLELWRRAGHELGNHTADHVDLNGAAPETWAASVRRCHDTLARRIGAPPRFFRYPYLREGNTPERQRAARELLAALAVRNAPVSVDNSEWVLAEAYAAAARRGDRAAMSRLADLYLDHMRRAVRHAREVARERFGREVRHVLLLHANRLNADHLDRLLEAVAREGARFVPLDTALADPIYAERDDYVGDRGLSWLYRVAPAQPERWAWDRAEEDAIRAALGITPGS
jgi:peptidoglycan/xylan/chitin deacetylase (PgdA/CDA1 family)